MNKSIHGHEVMQMMIDSGKSYTVEQLTEEIQGRFGQDARFHTCSRQDMSAQELIAFLKGKGKFTETDGGFRTDAGRICAH
ncbi:MAG: YecH family protein [Candidatus Omnitrophica bacterium]|nr:YecH family protein [Candidatus Omnitrophota bacterium]MCB9719983.1 YecH family protein [Candidatus Omnitrophota bacterium]